MSMTMKRILSLVLCFVMLVGYVPAGVLARAAETEISLAPVVEKAAVMEQEAAAEPAETTEVPVDAAAEEAAQAISYVTPEGFVDAALFFSDLHTNAGDYKETEIKSVFGKAATDAAVPFSAVVSVGDAFSSNETSYKGDTSYITEDIRTALQDNTVPVYYAWSDHDRGADVTNYTGLVDIESDEYYLYFISMSDMSPAERYGVPSTFKTEKLTAFTETVAGLDHTKPLFIASHMPLHARRGDNGYAKDWYKVISAAAELMDVAFFWGHNHTSEKPVDQAAFYVAKDGEETLAVEGMSKPVIPNFTYLNAGYMRGKDSVRANAVTAVTITEDAINYTVYGASGEIDGTYALDVTVTRDFAAEEENTVLYVDLIEGAGEVYAVGETLRYKLSASWSDGNVTYVTQEDVAVSAVKTAAEDAITLEEAMQTPGTYIATVVYEGKEVNFSFTVNAVEDDEEEETVTEELTLVIGGVEQTVEAKVATEDETVVAALAPLGLKAFVAYDIEAELAEGETAEVSIPIPEDWNTENLTAYYITNEGELSDETFEGLYENGFFTFTVRHFSKYVVGYGTEETEIDVPDNDTVSGSDKTTTTEEKEVYVLVSTPTEGKQYIIVSSNTAGSGYALKENTTTGSSITVNAASDKITAPYIETKDESLMWNATSGMKFQSENGGYYLRYNNGLTFSTRNSTNWTVGSNSAYTYSSNRYRYVYNSNGTWTTSSSWNTSTDYKLYFYEKQTVEVESSTTVTGTYSIDGEDISLVATKDVTKALKSTLIFAVTDAEDKKTDVSTTATYETKFVDRSGSTVNGDPSGIITKIENGEITFSGKYGTALVKVSYKTQFGEVTDYITVEAKAPYYTVELVKPVFTYTEAPNVTAEDVKNADAGTYFYESEGEYFAATGEDEEGMTYYTREITSPTAMEDTENWKRAQGGDEHVFWAVVKEHTAEHPEGVDIGNVPNDQLVWEYNENYGMLDEATGTFLFSGVYGTFPVTVTYLNEDGIAQDSDTVVINARASTGLTSNDSPDDFPTYPHQGAIRIDKTAEAVGTYSKTGIAKVELSMTGVPYTKNNVLDVAVMLDRSSSMTDVRINATKAAVAAFLQTLAFNEDGTPTGNRIYIGEFLGGNPSYAGQSQHALKVNSLLVRNEEKGYQIINNQNELEELIANINSKFVKQGSAYGTHYEGGLQECYELLQASKPDGNKQFCVFMSDGIPNVMKYGSGANDHITSSNNMAAMFRGTNYNTRDTDYKYEYYSTLMKEDNVTVYSVGIGLNGTNSALSGATAAQCYNVGRILLNDISGPAGETTPDTGSARSKEGKYFFDVADSNAAEDMTAVFEGISKEIRQAATDVEVHDELGDFYSMNFAMPKDHNNDAIDTGNVEQFYIQVVEYELDPVTHERKENNVTVKEKFTFKEDGSADAHEVDGVECSGCNHVKTTDGVITEIVGKYFTYTLGETITNVVDIGGEEDEDYVATGNKEYLTWKADKLDNHELALQYFAHLDNSADVLAGNQVPAGSYYTNESAYVTYTNFNGKLCEQVFPVPQMTWNGAQVTYRFYLVNDKGQPVNRTGTVVPFTEAVWVTGPYTHAVTWNDIEGTDKVFAQYILADAQVPGVYQLYDQGAGYTVRVYQTETVDGEEGTNFNYFRISGTEPNGSKSSTTKVFNTLTGTRYDAYGIYSHKNVGTNVGEGTVNYKTDNIDYANTTVAFAVVWTPGLTQDAVVVDYGLDVVVNVAMNDITGTTVKGVRGDKPAAAIDTGLYRNDDLKDTAQIMSSNVYKTYQLHAGEWVRTRSAYEGPSDAIVLPSPELPSTNGYEAGAEIAVYRSNIGVYQFYKLSDSQWKYVSETKTEPSSYYTELPEPTGTAGRTVVVRESWELGTATVESDYEVRFSQNENMKFNEPAVVYYETQYTWLNENKEYQTDCMYSSLTVIPATNVYYEDTFFTNVVNFVKNGEKITATQNVDRPGKALQNMPADYDHDNVYGYDSSYDTSSQFSLDSVLKAVVSEGNSASAEFDFYGTGFDIISLTNGNSGTISVEVTDANTGAEVKYMMVDTFFGYERVTRYIPYACEFTYSNYEKINGKWVKTNSATLTPESISQKPTDEPETPVKPDSFIVGSGSSLGIELTGNVVTELPDPNGNETKVVLLEKKWVKRAKSDTIQGELVEDIPAVSGIQKPTTVCMEIREWEVNTDEADTLYQIPVIHVNDLDYGSYHVRIVCEYKDFLDHAGVGSYEMYLDAIRIYNPTGNLNDTANEAYYEDGEGKPVYQELRELILDPGEATNDEAAWDGIIFIDHKAGDATAPYTIEDYRNFGPNNELYLDAGQAIAFELKIPANTVDVQIAMKRAGGEDIGEDEEGNEITIPASVNAELSVFGEDGAVVSESVGDISPADSAHDRYYSLKSIVTEARKAAGSQAVTIAVKLQNVSDVGILSITNLKFTYSKEATEAERVIQIGMNTALAANILARMNTPVVEEVEPEVVLKADLAVSVRNKNIKVGNNVILKATTSADVEYLTVNGQKITKFTEDKDTGKRTWSISVKAEEEGTMEVVVAACNGDRTLQTVVETVEVTAKKNGVVQQIVGQLIGMLTR